MHPTLVPFHNEARSSNAPLTREQRERFRDLFLLHRPLLGERYGARGFQKVPEVLDQGGSAKVIEWLMNYGTEMERVVREAGFNPFNIPSWMLIIDLLTDSGTSAMTDFQRYLLEAWAKDVREIETFAYAGSTAKAQLNLAVKEFFGENFSFYLTLQGRGAEFLLLKSLGLNEVIQPGEIVLSNRPFDTTKGHILGNGNRVVSCVPLTTPERYANAETIFLGDVPIEVMKEKYQEERDKVKVLLLTVTDNGGGGQPVSMQNVKEVAAFAREHGLILWIDACRMFENALFIQIFEKGYEEKSLLDIVREMLSYADIVTVSFKKIYSHTGGGILINRNSKLLSEKFESVDRAIKENTTIGYGFGFDGGYSGLTGRGMIEVISGLYVAVDSFRIAQRILQINRVYRELMEYGLPVVGGAHALYVAADRVLPNVGLEKCPAEYLNAMVSAAMGVRGCGLGNRLYGDWSKSNGVWKLTRPSEMDSLRYAFPRETYSTAFLTSILSLIGVAHKEGVFSGLTGGLEAGNYDTRGFYHFSGGYQPIDSREFSGAVAGLREILVARLANVEV